MSDRFPFRDSVWFQPPHLHGIRGRDRSNNSTDIEGEGRARWCCSASERLDVR